MKLLVTSTIVLMTLHAAAQGYGTDYPGFLQAAANKNLPECIDRGNQLLQGTRHPNILYKLAECYCQADSAAQSIRLLQELGDKGLPYNLVENPKLTGIMADPAFKALVKKFDSNRKSVQNSMDAFTLNDARLIPEGMAATSDGRQFFVGSLAQNKVVQYGVGCSQKDLVVPGQDGVWMVLGMKVSADNKTLWLCSASERDSVNGYSGIFGFDLASGRLRKKFTVDNKAGAHLFNDLVFAGNDVLYFTDSKAGKLWRLNLQDGAMTAMESGALVYPNGIALDEKAQVLYVADFVGIKRIDLRDHSVTQLVSKAPAYLNQVDGLYFYKHSLIAIQDSGNNDDRIVQFYLDQSGHAIERVKVLQSFHPDFIIPTTGVIVKNDFYYIANSQLRNLQPDGTLTNAEQLKKPLIKKVRLD